MQGWNEKSPFTKDLTQWSLWGPFQLRIFREILWSTRKWAWCYGTGKGETLLRLSSPTQLVAVAKLEQNPKKVQLLLEEAQVSCHMIFQLSQKCFLSWKNPGRGLGSRKSDLQEDPALDKRHPVPTSSSQRGGAQEGAQPAQLLLIQNKDFTQKKQNLAKPPGLKKFSLKSSVRPFPF